MDWPIFYLFPAHAIPPGCLPTALFLRPLAAERPHTPAQLLPKRIKEREVMGAAEGAWDLQAALLDALGYNFPRCDSQRSISIGDHGWRPLAHCLRNRQCAH